MRHRGAQSINTTPEQLAEKASAKFDLDDHSGPYATDSNGQGVAFLCRCAGARAATNGRPISEKEAPKPRPGNQSAKGAPAGHSPVSEQSQQPGDSFNRIAYPALFPDTPFDQKARDSSVAPSWHEHRKANWERYREKAK